MLEEERTTPIGLFNYAHSFWGAAKALDSLQRKEHVTHSDSPTEFLYWHAIELFLKAFLLADGVPLDKLRKGKFGHNITNLTAEAKKRKLPLTTKDQALLSFMPSTEDMIELRYLKVGARTRPEFFEIEATCQSLYQLVAVELRNRSVRMGFHDRRLRRQL